MKYFFFKDKNIGKSHLNKKMHCQDSYSGSFDIKSNISIGVVSDGHGNSLHFFSKFGSKLLADLVHKSLNEFAQRLNYLDLSRFQSSILNSFKVGVNNSYQLDETKDNILFDDLNNLTSQLFKSIVNNWNIEIEKHWSKNKPSKNSLQKKGINDDWINKFQNDINIEVAYGCTLIAYIYTPKYLFSFQLGDGTCVILNSNNTADFPIPNDVQCVGNTTTSMCEAEVINNFRYFFQVNNLPKAIFIASDGMDGAFSLIEDVAKERLRDFYLKVFNFYKDFGKRKTKNELKNAIKNFANNGVKLDDISLVCTILEI